MTSTHYRIQTDLPPAQAAALAQHLDIMHVEFSRRLSSLPPRAPAPMNVMLFAHELDYLETMQIRHQIEAVGTGGMFFARPSIAALAVWTGDLPRRRVMHVLQHEGFHQFAYSRFGTDLPLWANEGLAELFGAAVVMDDRVLVGQAAARAVDAVKTLIEQDAYVPFERMLDMGDDEWSRAVAGGDAAALYDQSWSMVHFLAYGDDGRHAPRFERYLTLLNAGFPPDHSFKQAFETDDAAAFEQAWKRYARELEPDGFITALERIEFLAEGALELSRDGVIPESLDALREALQAAGFAHGGPAGHAGKQRLEAGDEMFRIPWRGDPRIDRAPEFVVSPVRPYRMTTRERKLAEIRPNPPTIETRWLEPRDLRVNWTRDFETNTFTYEIEIRPPQR